MKKTAIVFMLLVSALPAWALPSRSNDTTDPGQRGEANGGNVGGFGVEENKKWRYAQAGLRPEHTGASSYEIAEDKKYATSKDPDHSEADYQTRGAKNAFNGVLTMWGKLIANALPSNEPLPEKKKEGTWAR